MRSQAFKGEAVQAIFSQQWTHPCCPPSQAHLPHLLSDRKRVKNKHFDKKTSNASLPPLQPGRHLLKPPNSEGMFGVPRPDVG